MAQGAGDRQARRTSTIQGFVIGVLAARCSPVAGSGTNDFRHRSAERIVWGCSGNSQQDRDVTERQLQQTGKSLQSFTQSEGDARRSWMTSNFPVHALW